MANPYVEILRTPGARAFVVAGFVGRLPLSMLGLGTVLLVTATTGSYALAGFVSGTLALAGALVGPQIGRLVDRFGQRRVLLPALVVHAAGLTALILCAQLDAPRGLLFASAFVAGAAYPSLGALVRTRWNVLLGGTPALQTAFALESVLDELVFTIGPVLVTLLATALPAPTGLIAALAFALGGGIAFAAQRSTEPAVRGGDGGASALRTRGMRVLIPIFVATGIVFGALDVAVVAFSQEHGAKAAAGLVLALFAVGSGAAGIAYGAHEWRAPLPRRLQISTLLLALATIPLALAQQMWTVALAAALAGSMVAPTLICGFALVQALVPRGALTEGLTWLSTSIAGGVALGLALAGQVVESASGHVAFRVMVGAALLAALLATALRRPLTPNR
jgi:MFS family permease